MAAPMITFILVPVAAVLAYFLFVPKQILVNKATFLENVEPMDVFNVMKDVQSYDKIDGSIVQTSIVLNNAEDDGSTRIHAHVTKKSDMFGTVTSSEQVTLSPSDLQIRVTSSSKVFKIFSMDTNGTLTFLTASRRRVPGTQFSVSAQLHVPLFLATIREAQIREEWEDFVMKAREYCLNLLAAPRVG